MGFPSSHFILWLGMGTFESDAEVYRRRRFTVQWEPAVSFQDLEKWIRSEVHEYGVRLSRGEGQRPGSPGDTRRLPRSGSTLGGEGLGRRVRWSW